MYRDQSQRRADDIMDNALSAGLIASPTSPLAQHLRALADVDPTAATAFVARRPPPLERGRFVIEQHGATLDGVRKVLRQLGHAAPDATIARFVGDAPPAPAAPGPDHVAAAATRAHVDSFDAALQMHGGSSEGVRRVLRQMGHARPDDVIAAHGVRALGGSDND